MRKLLLTTMAVLALGVTAQAADLKLPGKAPPLTNPFLTAGASGWYVGAHTALSIAPSSVSGTSFPSISLGTFTAAGGSLGGDVGYIWGNCLMQTWCQIEAGADWQNISGGVPGASAHSVWSAYGEFDFGAQFFQTLIAALPSLNGNNPFPIINPTGLLPANIAVAALPQQYFGGQCKAFQLDGTFASATGETVGGACGVDTGYRWITLNASGKPNGGSINIKGAILFPSKGVTLNNVFGTGGAPITIGAAVNEKMLATLTFQYDFGL